MTSHSDSNAADSAGDADASTDSTGADRPESEDGITTSGGGHDEPSPAILPLADVQDVWQSLTASGDGSTREVTRDLTPDEVDTDRPEEFDFEYIPTEELPTGVQYTPDFDPDWVYTSGSEDGGRQDDTPVQGLEIGVLATDETIEATVHAILDAIALYYDDTGGYPRHRIIKSAEAFRDVTTNGVGVVAALQPSPDRHEGLIDHMEAVQSGAEGAIDSNVENSRIIVQYLGMHLVNSGVETSPDDIDIHSLSGLETATQVGTLPVVERYAPLGAAEVYDPNIDDLDLSEDGVSSITEVEFTPDKLSIETNAELFDTADTVD